MEEPRDDATTGDDFAYSYKSSLIAAPFEFRLTSDALHWRKGGASGHTLYRNIRRVRLSFRPMTMQNSPASSPKSGRTDPSSRSLRRPGRAWSSMSGSMSRYRVFIAELCRRIGAAGGQTRLQTGSPPIMYWIGVVVFVGASLALASLIVRALQFAAWGARRVHRGVSRPCSCGRPARSSAATAPARFAPDAVPEAVLPRGVAAACAPPAPSTWRSAPCGRRSSRGSRSSSRAGASSSR